jgi:hypothetical protein
MTNITVRWSIGKVSVLWHRASVIVRVSYLQMNVLKLQISLHQQQMTVMPDRAPEAELQLHE